MGTTSTAKTAANRKNARKSTGPKTTKGKQVVKYNALKHGLLAREAVLTAGDGKESQGDFKQLLESLVANTRPVGPMEEMLLERIAICYWRLRRAIRAEAGEIRKRADSAVLADSFDREDTLNHNLGLVLFPAGRTGVRRCPQGLEKLIWLVESARDELDATSSLSDHVLDKISRYYGPDEDSFGFKLRVITHVAQIRFDDAEEDAVIDDVENNGEEDDEDPFDEYSPFIKKTILEMLDEELARLREMKTKTETRDKLALDAELLSMSLPDDKAINRILRYETTIERQLYRALNQLERLQRARLGDAVPPPINIELSASA